MMYMDNMCIFLFVCFNNRVTIIIQYIIPKTHINNYSNKIEFKTAFKEHLCYVILVCYLNSYQIR